MPIIVYRRTDAYQRQQQDLDSYELCVCVCVHMYH